MQHIRSQFPSDFTFGVATSAYQIEGAAFEEGRKASIWDTFARQHGRIADGTTGDIACDHYHRYREDVQLMANLGVRGYRFSTAWPRVLPDGWGKKNQAGIDFYSRLVDELLEKSIEPFVTLYHWDLPQALEDKGGWLNRDTAKAFEEYAVLMAEVLGDRVTNWMTHNEMWCASHLSYQIGMFAPGHTDWREALAAAHHILLSHGLAVRSIRTVDSRLALGIAPNYLPAFPRDEQSDSDRDAANRYDGYFNRWFLDPLTGRGYPTDMLELYGDLSPTERQGGEDPVVQNGDLEVIAQPLEFIGVNYYNANWYTSSESEAPIYANKSQPSGLWETADRDVYAPGLYKAVERLWKDYGFAKIFVTENGAAFDDKLVDDNGEDRVHDAGRVRFLTEHFEQAARLLEDGAPLAGFFVWSLMDNFEWAAGYTIRYGIHYTDYRTQERIPKDSALWYRDFIRD